MKIDDGPAKWDEPMVENEQLFVLKLWARKAFESFPSFLEVTSQCILTWSIVISSLFRPTNRSMYVSLETFAIHWHPLHLIHFIAKIWFTFKADSNKTAPFPKFYQVWVESVCECAIVSAWLCQPKANERVLEKRISNNYDQMLFISSRKTVRKLAWQCLVVSSHSNHLCYWNERKTFVRVKFKCECVPLFSIANWTKSGALLDRHENETTMATTTCTSSEGKTGNLFISFPLSIWK